MASVTLDVQPLTDALFPEGVMTTSNSLYESQAQQERAQVVEAYVRVRLTAQDPLSQSFVRIRHCLCLGLEPSVRLHESEGVWLRYIFNGPFHRAPAFPKKVWD